MENIAKALLIAAAVLIGVFLLANYNRTMRETSEFTESYMSKLTEKDIAEYNSDFVKYTGIDMNMYEVVTLINKSLAIDESCNFEKNSLDYITIKLNFKTSPGTTYNYADFIGHFYQSGKFNYDDYNEARFKLLKAYYDDSISWEGTTVDQPKNVAPTLFRISKIEYKDKRVSGLTFDEK